MGKPTFDAFEAQLEAKDYTFDAQEITEMSPKDWALYYASQLDKYDSRVKCVKDTFGLRVLLREDFKDYLFTGFNIVTSECVVYFFYNVHTGYIRAYHIGEDKWLSPPCSASSIMSFVWTEIGVDPVYLETCEDGYDEEELRDI